MITRLFQVESWVTQYFGQNEFAGGRYASGFHNGLDLVPIDRFSWFVYAPIGGNVVSVGNDHWYGLFVIIHDSRLGVRYRLAHLESHNLAIGDTVTAGELVGTAGESGNVTGRHLHIDMQFMRHYPVNDFPGSEYGGWMDPLPALRMIGVHI